MSNKRGPKPLGKTNLHARVNPQTLIALRKKAQKLGFNYGDSGATGEMLDAIAEGKVVLILKEDWEKIKFVATTINETGIG